MPRNAPHLLLLVLLLVLTTHSQGCHQLCANCTNGVCLSCYEDWTVQAGVYSTPCRCPTGYYSNITTSGASTRNLCNFCPVECITCTNYTMCTQCLGSYVLLPNGTCVTNFSNSQIRIAYDLNNTAINNQSFYGFTYIN